MKSDDKNILVIGNGFDLHHGMMTSYADLLCFYINIKDNTKQYDIDEETKKEVLSWPSNSFFDYFVSDYEDRKNVKSWIDLEHGIKQYIKTVIDFFEEENRKIRNNDSKAEIGEISYQGRTQEIAHMLINSHALGKTDQRRILIEKKFITFQGLYDIEEILNAFADELRGLEGIVAYYLKEIEPNIREDKKRYHQFKQINDIKPLYIISFNYTNTVGDLYAETAPDISFIHGELSSDNIVLGYDDNKQQEGDIVFKKFYRRIIKNTNTIDERKTRDSDGGFIRQRNVYIFGHSLDISDEDILAPLLEKHNTVIFYRNDTEYASKIKNLFLLLDKDKVIERINEGNIKFERIQGD